MTFIRRHVFRLTPRQKYEINKPPALNFAVYYGASLIAFLVALCYAVVQPLILPFACGENLVLFVFVQAANCEHTSECL